MAALTKLPPVGNTVVFRGIKMPLADLLGDSAGHVDNFRFLWASFTSTTRSSRVLRSDEFLGDGAHHGDRTAFQICAVEGRDISAYSYFGANGNADVDSEEEILLLPGSCFEVEIGGISTYSSNGVTEVKVRQLSKTSESDNNTNIRRDPESQDVVYNVPSSLRGVESAYEDLYGTLRESFVDDGLWWQRGGALSATGAGIGVPLYDDAASDDLDC